MIYRKLLSIEGEDFKYKDLKTTIENNTIRLYEYIIKYTLGGEK
jgi:hypothetical protein